MTTLTKTRNYKGRCIVDVRINPFAGKRHIKAYSIDGIDGRFFSTVKHAKSWIDNHLHPVL